MDSWLIWARGPAFVFAFSFMVLGLIRVVVLTLWEIRGALRRAGDRSMPYKQLFIATMKWLFPVGKISNRLVFSATTLLFHIAVLVVPIFLAGHIALWARGLGVRWPALSNEAADALTIVAVITAVALVIQRALARDTRRLSRLGDFVIPLLVALPFASGFLVMHPAANPFSHEATLFVHVMTGNLLFVLIPLTKLRHAAMMPFFQIVSEVAWHWPADAGSRVAATLGKEDTPI